MLFRSLENSVLDFGQEPNVIHGRGICQCITRTITPPNTKYRLVVEYRDCAPKFSLESAVNSILLNEHKELYDDVKNTILEANKVVKSFTGVATKNQRLFILLIIIGIIIILCMGIPLGSFVHFSIPIVLFLLLIVVVVLVFFYFRKKNKKLLFYGFIVLSIFARCENNRYYLDKRILIRPGYMSNWLEFNMDDNYKHSTI